MPKAYTLTQLEDILDACESHLIEAGYRVKRDVELHADVGWRPDLVAVKGDGQLAIDVLFDGLIPQWIDLDALIHYLPEVKVWWVIPSEMPVPHDTYQTASGRGHFIYIVEQEALTCYLDPDEIIKIQMTQAFPVDEADLQQVTNYRVEIRDAKKAYAAGLPREAVGIMGRILETACFDTIEEGRKHNKIRVPASRVSKMTFHDVVHFLHNPVHRARRSRRVIDERQRDNILSVKWDRNVADHRATAEEIAEVIAMAVAKIKIALESLKLLVRRQERFRRR